MDFEPTERQLYWRNRVRDFIAAENPPALQEMAARFAEARDRGLWRPGANDIPALLDAILRAP
jgi:cobaltochelatase CobN